MVRKNLTGRMAQSLKTTQEESIKYCENTSTNTLLLAANFPSKNVLG